MKRKTTSLPKRKPYPSFEFSELNPEQQKLALEFWQRAQSNKNKVPHPTDVRWILYKGKPCDPYLLADFFPFM